MKTKQITIKSIVLTILLGLLPFTGVASAQTEGIVIAEGFNGPQGILVAPDGNIWVIDSGVGGDEDLPFIEPATGQEITAKYGESARIVKVTPEGAQEVAATLPSVVAGMDTLGGARLALVGDTLYATSGQFTGQAGAVPSVDNIASVVKIENGQATEVANIWAFESSQNPDGHILDSHPYGLVAGADGNLLVADAGGNSLLSVDPASGTVETVAAFKGLPGPFPNPNRAGTMEVDPVPTGVAVDQSGTIYVSFLSGFPFLPGSAKVVQISPDGQVSDYATGLTTLTDLRVGPDGNLYAVQFGQFSEQGPAPNSGAIIRVKAGEASEVVASGLSFPTSIDFNTTGDAYVMVNGVGAPGSGQVVRFDALTSQSGTPLPAPETAAPPAGGDAPEAAPATEAPAEAPAAAAPETLPQSGAAAPGSRTGMVLAALGLMLLVGGYTLRRKLVL